MIELYSGNLLVDDNGSRCSLDLEQLREELRDCCAGLGMRDPWLADHAVTAVEDFFAIRENDNRIPPTRAEIDLLITRLFLDAGYSDVAVAYSRRRNQVRPDAEAGTSQEWNDVRVQQLISRQFPLDPAVAACLHRHVIKHLRHLGFRSITDTLILELAGHQLHQAEEPVADLSLATPWLLSPEAWGDDLTGATLQYWRAGVLVARPVSRLNPAARVVIDLDRLAVFLSGEQPLTELQFWPELNRVSVAVRDILSRMHHRIREMRKQPLAGHAWGLIAGMAGLLQTLEPQRRKPVQRQLLAAEIIAAVKRGVADSSDLSIVIRG